MNHSRLSVRRLIVAVITGALLLTALSTAVPGSASARRKPCTDVVRGANNSEINVVSGQRMCLKDAQQTGDVNVASGGALSVVGSTIDGAVNVNSGFKKFKFCASSITSADALTVSSGSTKPVLIGKGNASSKCPGNTFGGAVNIDNNNGPLHLSRNTIVGAVTMNANKAGMTLGRNSITGAVTVSNNLVKTVITGNTIEGALTCSANSPAPVNADRPNSVEGARSGQTCANASF